MNRTHQKYDALIARATPFAPLRTAVAHPCDASSLTGAVDAARTGLIAPMLVGRRSRITAVASQCALELTGVEIVDTGVRRQTAAKAVA